MAKIGGFDPNLGITPFTDGRHEIGRTNLPASMRVIPDSATETGAAALVYGKLSDSTLLERFAAYLAPNIRHRELLAPEVFFEVLAAAARSFEQAAGEQRGQPEEGPLAQAARTLREILADRDLCETLRNLVVRA